MFTYFIILKYLFVSLKNKSANEIFVDKIHFSVLIHSLFAILHCWRIWVDWFWNGKNEYFQWIYLEIMTIGNFNKERGFSEIDKDGYSSSRRMECVLYVFVHGIHWNPCADSLRKTNEYTEILS